MRKKLIAGNWKMYKSAVEAASFAREWSKRGDPSVETVIFCQAPLLPVLQQECAEFRPFHYGPQNIYWEEKGAFTGELSPKLAQEFGAAYALAGHSERRQLFGETHESAAKRALAAHAFGMKAV